MNAHRSYFAFAALAAALTLGGCHSNKDQNQADNQNPDASMSGQPSGQAGTSGNKAAPKRRTPPPPEVVELPAGTEIPVRLDQDLSSKDSQPGETFSATVANDVVVNGKVIIPKDARADGTVVDAKPLGKFKGGALLAVKLDRVKSSWGTYPVETAAISRAEAGKGKRSAGMIGGGAGLGALIGGLAGGGKGALIGGLAGAGAGTAGSAFTGNKQIVLPAETLLTFKLDRSVRITESNRADQQDPSLQTR